MKSLLEQFLEYFPYGPHLTPDQNREIASLNNFVNEKPINQINKLALDLNLTVSYLPDGSINIK